MGMNRCDQDIFSSAPVRPGFEELLADYVGSMDDAVARLQAAHRGGNGEEVESEVHRMAGSLGLYGYAEVERSFRQVLAALRQGQSPADLDAELRGLEQVLQRIRARP